MESKEDPAIDIRSLQKEVIEMRKLIPDAYKGYLDLKFDKFKANLANAATERVPIEVSQLEIPKMDTTIFESEASSRRYDANYLKQYVNNALEFIQEFKESKEQEMMKMLCYQMNKGTTNKI